MNLIAEGDDERGLDKWIEEAHSPSFKSRTHFQLCLFYRLWASTKSLVNLNVTFMLNQAKPISIQSGGYPSLCCIIMDTSQSQIHSSPPVPSLKGQTVNIQSPCNIEHRWKWNLSFFIKVRCKIGRRDRGFWGHKWELDIWIGGADVERMNLLFEQTLKIKSCLVADEFSLGQGTYFI